MQSSWIQFSHLKYSNLLYQMLLMAGFVPWLQVSFCILTIYTLMCLKSMSRTTNMLSSDVPATLQPVYHTVNDAYCHSNLDGRLIRHQPMMRHDMKLT